MLQSFAALFVTFAMGGCVARYPVNDTSIYDIPEDDSMSYLFESPGGASQVDSLGDPGERLAFQSLFATAKT